MTRISKALMKEYLQEVSEDDPNFGNNILNSSTKAEIEAVVPKRQSGKKRKAKDSPSMIDLIGLHLDKKNELIDISLNLPILKKDYFHMLMEVHPKLLDDLVDIIEEKYINKDFLRTQIKDALDDFYGLNEIVDLELEETI